MSYYQQQGYAQYQAQQPYIPQNATQYTPYQAAGQSAGSPSAAYPIYATAAFRPSSPLPSEATSISAPEFADVTPKIASQVVQRLASSELRHAGFDSADPAALTLLELECVGCALSRPRLCTQM